MTDHDSLIAQHSALVENLPPGVRRTQALAAQMRRDGQVALATDPREDNHLIGLDDDLQLVTPDAD